MENVYNFGLKYSKGVLSLLSEEFKPVRGVSWPFGVESKSILIKNQVMSVMH